jgi:mannose-6-phosphate isomerase-like protein (cupin superfamily)
MSDGVRNLDKALAAVTEHWQPHRLTSVNDYDVKVAKVQGEFVWHTHPDTDEQLRDGDVTLGPGDTYVVPRGVEHCPKADQETSIVMVEPKGTVNTGDAGGALTSPLRELPV